jgi:hypothetical protein
MNARHALPVLLLACAFAAGAQAQTIGYNFRSGDLWVDSQLGYFSDYGRRDRDYFVDDLVNSYGAPRYLVNELLDKRRWDPGDVYYAAALAYSARRPLVDVTREYENSKGQGWGVVAQRMGIKPGSAEFHALKGQLGKSKGRYDAHGGHGKPGDAAGPGNSGAAHGNGGKGRDDEERGEEGHGDAADEDHGKGHADKDEGDKGKGDKGKGGKSNNGKGHGH